MGSHCANERTGDSGVYIMHLGREVNMARLFGGVTTLRPVFDMQVGRRAPSQSDTKPLDFQRADVPQGRRLVRKKLKGRIV